MSLVIKLAQLDDKLHQEIIVQMINEYAADPMANGKPLLDSVLESLIDGLRKHPTTMIFLAQEEDRYLGIAVCFLGFSTFAAKPLINIHDLYVRPEARGQRLATRMLESIEAKALALGCCKLTLEVFEHNRRAYSVYDRFGFEQAKYVEEAGGALFMAKKISLRASNVNGAVL